MAHALMVEDDELLCDGPTAQKRPYCSRCLRPQSTCICQWITPTDLAAEVVILQHPLEVHAAKGSARLLHLSLARSQLLAGEVFGPEVMEDLLAGPRQAVLLYPQTPGAPEAVALSAKQLRNPSQVRLIVLDGTWRKSRKMLHLNPLLQAIPRLSLGDVRASRYLIRKAHRPNQLSTLEATCAALMHLEAFGGCDSEDASRRFLPLLSAFDGFVAQQMANRQRSVDD